MKIAETSKIDFFNIHWRKENQTYIIWKDKTSNFIELTEIPFKAFKLLKEGNTPIKVAEILETNYKETYDVTDFIQELGKLGFISTIDGIPIPSTPNKKPALAFLKKKHVKWIYSKPLLILYLAFIFSAFIILIFNPSYFPSYNDLFFIDNTIVVLAVSFALGLTLVFFHELGHLLAGKAAGIEGYFSIGLRLYIPVAETNLTQLWTVPRKKRYVPFLAGMLNDTLVLSFLVFILWISDLSPTWVLGSIAGFARLVILLLYYSLVWQFLLFIRTDLYFVISNFLGCRNLYSDSWNLILNSLLKLFKGKEIERRIPANELRIVKIYAPIMLSATTFSIIFFAFFGLPIFVLIFIEGFDMIFNGLQSNAMLFAEGLILTCLIGIQIFGFLLFIIRSLLSFNSRLKMTRKET